MPEEEQNLSAAMRAARRSVWEQAKAAGIQNDETPPPVPTGKETGFNDDPRIARLEGIVRDLAGRLDDLEDDYPESEIGNGVGGGGSTYSSYFRVIDASTESACKIGVEDGGDTAAANCGDVKVNGTVKSIAKYASDALTAEGTYRVWLFCWIDETTGAGAEIIVGGAGSSTRPTAPVVASPANVLTYGSQLLGRATVASNGAGGYIISAINQDYLRGGEAVEVLFGECGADVEVEL